MVPLPDLARVARGPKQAEAVAFLQQHGPQPTARIAEFLGDKDPARANTHSLLQRLEELGFVRRNTSVRPQLWESP
jgi:DNA-binding IclR family transcriptional regulator